MPFQLIGIASAVLFIAGDVPYVLDTFSGKTHPHRVTWGVFTLLNAIGFANQYASGASSSLWLFGAGALMTGLIFLGSLRGGEGGKSKADVICLVAALLGVSLWFLLKSPTYSIFANIIADAAALWPTYKKAWQRPESETRVAWLVGTLSVVLDAISVGKLDWRLLILPLASTILQGYVVFLLYFHTGPSQIHSKTASRETTPL